MPSEMNVQAQNRDHDGETREQRLPPAAGQNAAARVGKDVAPRRRGLGNTRADEGERCLEDDGVGHEHDGEHHDRSDAVANDVLDKNPRSTGAGNHDGTHVVLIVLADDVRAHDAGDLRDIEEADGENQRRQVRSEHHDEGGGQSDAREGHDDVEDTLMITSETHLRETAASAPMIEPQISAKPGGAKADDERIASAVHHARQKRHGPCRRCRRGTARQEPDGR